MPEGPRRVEVCLTSSDTPTFKEQTLGLHADRPSVGLCFSGGGARALSASMGYYRALTSLGLMDKVRVISAVSGGPGPPSSTPTIARALKMTSSY